MTTATTFESLLPQIVPFEIPRPLKRALGIEELEALYQEVRGGADGGSIADRLLDRLAVTDAVSTAAHMPPSNW